MSGGPRGVIDSLPEDWSTRSIGDVCKLFGRIGFRGYTVKDIVEEGQGAISLSPSNIQNSKLCMKKSTFITWRKWEESPEIKIENGDIILVKTGSTVGKAAIVRGLYSQATLNPQLVVLKKRRIDEHFLGYVVLSDEFQRQLAATVVGGALPTLSQKEVAAYTFACPNRRDEQEAIATALKDIDDFIASLDALIAKKRDIKQAAMQQLLTGKTRLTGFEGDWKSASLSQISEFITKGATPTTYGFGWVSDGILFLRSECVAQDKLDLSQSMFISEEANRVLRRSEVQSGDILMTITGNVGRVVLLPPSVASANINQHIARIRIQAESAFAPFVFHHLTQRCVREHFCSIVTGQAYPQISLNQVRNAAIPLPSPPEQIAIASVLTDMDNDIGLIEEKLEKAKQVKGGMMQQLLTGRIRLV